MMKFKALLFALAGAVIFSAGAAENVVPYKANEIKGKYNYLTNISAERNVQKIKELIAEYQGDPRFDAKARYCVDMIDAAFKAGDPKRIKLPKAPEGMSATEMEQAFFNAAKVFMQLRDYPMAQYFGTVRQKETPLYLCKIVDKAPQDVTAWENFQVKVPIATEFEKYNEQAAALLINDVNSVRDTATLKSDKNCPISFRAVADKYGISIYVKAITNKQDEIAAGLAYGGTYEMYIQPGHGNYYHQWLYNVKQGVSNSTETISWMTPNKNFRPLDHYLQ